MAAGKTLSPAQLLPVSTLYPYAVRDKRTQGRDYAASQKNAPYCFESSLLSTISTTTILGPAQFFLAHRNQ